MHVAIPADFEAFARDQVKAGAFASEEEAVAAALKDYLDHLGPLRSAVREGLSDLDRGDVVDGEAFMAELLDETKARAADRAG